MAIRNMTRVDFDTKNPNTGAIYHEKIVLADSETSDTIKIPTKDLDQIGINLIGDGTVYFTFSSPSNIDAATALWLVWDGSSDVNKAVTGFYVESNSGAVTAEVTIRSEDD